MNLIHNIERHDKTKQQTEVQQIKTELNRVAIKNYVIK